MREKVWSNTGLKCAGQVCVVWVAYVVFIAVVGAVWESIAAERAPVESWKQHREQAAQAFQKDDLRQAENHLLQSLHEAERLNTVGPEVFLSLIELGWCNFAAENYAAGLAHLRRALTLSETNHAVKAVDTGVCLAWCGELQLRQRDLEAAKKMFERGSEVLDAAPSLSSERALCALGLGEVALAEIEYSKAEEHFKAALALLNDDIEKRGDSDILQSPFRPAYPTLADVLNALGNLYQIQKRWGEAEARYRQTVELVEKEASSASGALPAALNALASFYLDRTNFAAARPLLERSLKAQERAIGPAHPVLIPTLSNLARAEENLGDAARAEGRYRRILAIREKSLGPDHIRVQDSLRELSQLYLKQKDFAAAEPLCRRMLTREESFRGETSITLTPILSDLETIYRQQGKLKELEAVYQKQLRVFESAFGPTNNCVAKVLEAYAALLRGQQRQVEATKLEERARALRNTAGK